MESKKRIDRRKLLVAAIFIFSLAGLGVSQVYAQSDSQQIGVLGKIANLLITNQQEEEPEVTVTPTPRTSLLNYEIADAYKRLGRPDLAYAQLQTAVVSNPVHFLQLPSKEELKEIQENGNQPDENFIRGYEAKQGLYTVLESIKAKVIYFLTWIAYLIALIIIYRWVSVFITQIIKCRFDVGDFEEGSKIDCAPKEGFQSLVEKEIWSLSDRNGLDSNNLIFEPLENPSFDESVSLSQVKDIGALLKIMNTLFSPNVITLTGTIYYSADRGAGVTLQLVKKKTRIIAEATLWQKEFDPDYDPSSETNDINCFYKLAEPVAYWASWFFKNDFNGMGECKSVKIFKKIIKKYPNIKKELIRSYGTDNLDSAMANYQGAKFAEKIHQKNNKDTAFSYFYQSLNFDPYNRQALFNLATKKISAISEEYLLRREKEEGRLSLPNQGGSIIDFSQPVFLLNRVVRLSYKSLTNSSERIVLNNLFNKEIKIDQFPLNEKNFDRSRIDNFPDSILALAHYHLGAIGEYTYLLNNCDDSFIKFVKLSKLQFENCENTLIKINRIEKRTKSKQIRADIQKMMIVAKKSNENLVKIVTKNSKVIDKLDLENEIFSKPVAYNLACHYATNVGKFFFKKTKSEEQIRMYMEKTAFFLNMAIEGKDDNELRQWANYDPSLYPYWEWKK